MPLKSGYFVASTVSMMPPDATVLPLSPIAEKDLQTILAEDGDYTFLTLRSDIALETVKLTNDNGVLVMERGLEGTLAIQHPYGTCVSSVSPTIIAVIKDLVCNYDCCELSDCECVPVRPAGSYTPAARVGVAWEGAAIFTGSVPMHLTSMDAPAWMEVVQESQVLKFSGTPTQAGVVTFTALAANCNGTELASVPLRVTITD